MVMVEVYMTFSPKRNAELFLDKMTIYASVFIIKLKEISLIIDLFLSCLQETLIEKGSLGLIV
jgi:hypothetical protein